MRETCPICTGGKFAAAESTPIILSMQVSTPPKCETCNGTGVLNDRALIAAYQRTSGEPGDAEADALLAEIQLRNLDL